jgi:hypothetical protein
MVLAGRYGGKCVAMSTLSHQVNIHHEEGVELVNPIAVSYETVQVSTVSKDEGDTYS